MSLDKMCSHACHSPIAICLLTVSLYDTNINYTTPAYWEWSPVLVNVAHAVGIVCPVQALDAWCPIFSVLKHELLCKALAVQGRRTTLCSDCMTRHGERKKKTTTIIDFMTGWDTFFDRWSLLRRVRVCPQRSIRSVSMSSLCFFSCASSSPDCLPRSFKLKSRHLLLWCLLLFYFHVWEPRCLESWKFCCCKGLWNQETV